MAGKVTLEEAGAFSQALGKAALVTGRLRCYVLRADRLEHSVRGFHMPLLSHFLREDVIHGGKDVLLNVLVCKFYSGRGFGLSRIDHRHAVFVSVSERFKRNRPLVFQFQVSPIFWLPLQGSKEPGQLVLFWPELSLLLFGQLMVWVSGFPALEIA